MLNLIALALFQISSLTISPEVAAHPTTTVAVATTDDHGTGGWTGVTGDNTGGTPTTTAEHGTGGWTGIDGDDATGGQTADDHGTGGWTGIDGDHGTGGWTGIDDHGTGGWTGK